MTLSNHLLPVIDAHVHVHPNVAADLLVIMETNSLSRVVNLGILEMLCIPFEEGMRAFHKVLGNRMVYFSTPDFSNVSRGFGERMAENLERKVEAGACGLKIFKELGLRHKDADGNLIPVDDPRLDPLWAKAGELGVPVLIHTADPVAFFQPLDEANGSWCNERWDELQLHPDWHFGKPEFLDHDTLLAQRNRVIERHPDTTFIGAHLGNYPENLTYVDGCLDRYPNFTVDTSARIGEIGRHPAEESRAFFIKHQDRVILGTDLVLGWDAFDDEGVGDLAEYGHFYDAHWRFFETNEQQIEHPGFPIAGRWKVDAISFSKFKKMDDVDALVLFSGTWVWAAHLIAPLRDFSFTGKGIVLWTNPGSQGWRPVGGLVLDGDLQHIDKSNNEIKIIGDGTCPPSLAGEVGPAGFAEHGIPTEGEAGGLSVKLVCKAGEGVLARLNRDNGEFEMAVARCSVFEPPAEQLEERRRECGIPFWPHAFVTAHCDIDKLIEVWGNEYAVLGYGDHLYDDLLAFCELTGIKAIAL